MCGARPPVPHCMSVLFWQSFGKESEIRHKAPTGPTARSKHRGATARFGGAHSFPGSTTLAYEEDTTLNSSLLITLSVQHRGRLPHLFAQFEAIASAAFLLELVTRSNPCCSGFRLKNTSAPHGPNHDAAAGPEVFNRFSRYPHTTFGRRPSPLLDLNRPGRRQTLYLQFV